MTRTFDKRSGLAFIIAFGIVSLFADAAYEGMRGINGAFLGSLGASGLVVGVVAGAGELFGYLIRLVSGRIAQKTGLYWPMAIFGYALAMAAVPLMAFAFNWQTAALFVILERSGKAIRSPATNTMQSRAGDVIGQGWAFGLQEALDQTGAIIGPLITAYILAKHGDFHAAYAWLGVPALLTMTSVIVIALRYGYAGCIRETRKKTPRDYSRAFWWYAASAALLGFGFADFSLMAFHLLKAGVVTAPTVPIYYAIAMGASGAGALVFGRWFDARGLVVLIPAALIGAAATPLVFLGGAEVALAGVILWGIAIGVQGSMMSASVARLVPEAKRAQAYGLFSALYGVFWFAGSALLGLLYDRSLIALVCVAAAAQLLSIIPLWRALRNMR
ncbi:MAG TPA: MFS transporter [Rhizomicrobium sp.]